MSKSKRIYINLNESKEKDKLIIDYLELTYSASETIKSILFQIASKRSNLNDVLDSCIDTNSNTEVQNVVDSINDNSNNTNDSAIKINNEIMEMFN